MLLRAVPQLPCGSMAATARPPTVGGRPLNYALDTRDEAMRFPKGRSFFALAASWVLVYGSITVFLFPNSQRTALGWLFILTASIPAYFLAETLAEKVPALNPGPSSSSAKFAIGMALFAGCLAAILGIVWLSTDAGV